MQRKERILVCGVSANRVSLIEKHSVIIAKEMKQMVHSFFAEPKNKPSYRKNLPKKQQRF